MPVMLSEYIVTGSLTLDKLENAVFKILQLRVVEHAWGSNFLLIVYLLIEGDIKFYDIVATLYNEKNDTLVQDWQNNDEGSMYWWSVS